MKDYRNRNYKTGVFGKSKFKTVCKIYDHMFLSKIDERKIIYSIKSIQALVNQQANENVVV